MPQRDDHPNGAGFVGRPCGRGGAAATIWNGAAGGGLGFGLPLDSRGHKQQQQHKFSSF